MDNRYDILQLLRQVAEGDIPPEEALLQLKREPFQDLGYAKVDFHRSVRQGAAEVIYGAGKTPEQIAGIAGAMGERGCHNVLITRLSREAADLVGKTVPLDYHPVSRLAVAWGDKVSGPHCGSHRWHQRHGRGRGGCPHRPGTG